MKPENPLARASNNSGVEKRIFSTNTNVLEMIEDSHIVVMEYQ